MVLIKIKKLPEIFLFKETITCKSTRNSEITFYHYFENHTSFFIIDAASNPPVIQILLLNNVA